MSKAERFENEKKRIIESCFAKKDSDGSGRSHIYYCQRPSSTHRSGFHGKEKYSVIEEISRILKHSVSLRYGGSLLLLYSPCLVSCR